MSDDAPTHTAFALRRESRSKSHWVEIGHARITGDGSNIHHVFLDRMPIGGWTGKFTLAPVGSRPPDPKLVEPERPADT
jgi:hypothetical protein